MLVVQEIPRLSFANNEDRIQVSFNPSGEAFSMVSMRLRRAPRGHRTHTTIKPKLGFTAAASSSICNRVDPAWNDATFPTFLNFCWTIEYHLSMPSLTRRFLQHELPGAKPPVPGSKSASWKYDCGQKAASRTPSITQSYPMSPFHRP